MHRAGCRFDGTQHCVLSGVTEGRLHLNVVQPVILASLTPRSGGVGHGDEKPRATRRLKVPLRMSHG